MRESNIDSSMGSPSSVRKRPKGYRPKVRRIPAKLPLSNEEERLVIEEAGRLTWNLRSAIRRNGSYRPNFEDNLTSDWAQKCVLFALRSGIHPSVIGTLSSANLVWDDDAGEEVLVYHRPKTQRLLKWLPANDCKPWLAAWLDQPKPSSPGQYYRIFRRVGDAVGRRLGRPFHFGPLRARHTALARFYHDHNLTAEETSSMAGTTLRTLQTYARRGFVDVVKKLREDGY